MPAASPGHRCGHAAGGGVAGPDRPRYRGLSRAWRLCRASFADLSGDGARRYGGRWNSPGRPIVYLAADPALSVLEVRVHLDLPPDLLPDDYVLLAVDLAGLAIEDCGAMPAEPSGFGDAWLREGRTPVLRAPSAIVAESVSLLLNPAHPDASMAAIIASRPVAFDQRLWRTG